MRIHLLWLLLPLWGCMNVSSSPPESPALDRGGYVRAHAEPGAFPLLPDGAPAPIVVDAADYPGVWRLADRLAEDWALVGGTKPAVHAEAELPQAGRLVLVGTVGHCQWLDQLVEAGKLDLSALTGQWEAFQVSVVDAPFAGVEQALVIAGADKRGTLFGMFDLARQIGVSPWYWWADVPVQPQTDLYVAAGDHLTDEPAVRYRGIFLNDEAPALAGWAEERYGGFNHQFYEQIFELMLRLRANYLWPAMWGRAFYDDDSLNAALADTFGIVIGTTHHEPLMRAHVEWERYGEGAWNYQTNERRLRQFWRKGIRRMGDHETIVSVGMRGDGDRPMSEESNIELLERIVADQRKIIAEETGKPAAEVPQLWALYKEVQDYYDQGMRVPEDITLLLCDDNWGNLRKLPQPGESRAGGYGIYYHFDYVGGPRNYKWLNTNAIPRVWEQMHLAWAHGVERIWIVNVGDLKPMELPTQFFLDMAWDPAKMTVEAMSQYPQRWAAQQFGPEHAKQIGELLDRYTRYNARRKPELLNLPVYNLVAFREAERVLADWRQLEREVQQLAEKIPAAQQDAFYQLVQFPILASANLNALYLHTQRNRLYAQQGRVATNSLADSVRACFARDAELTRYFHQELSEGKWNHMMAQTHIGYTYWQQPEQQVMPTLARIEPSERAELAWAVEGSERWWPAAQKAASLPAFDPYQRQRHYFELFNRGSEPFDFTISASEPWIKLSTTEGRIETQQRIEVSIAWDKVPAEARRGQVIFRGPTGQGGRVQVELLPRLPEAEGFVQGPGYVAMEAADFQAAVADSPWAWVEIPGLGKTQSGLMATPVTQAVGELTASSPHLVYPVFLRDSGTFTVEAYLSPTLDFYNQGGLRYAISIDDQPPVVMNMHEHPSAGHWSQWVSANIIRPHSQHQVAQPGKHLLKFWRIDPGVVLQRLVVKQASLPETYLGPPESGRGK